MKKSVIVTFEGDDADLESFLQWLTGHRLVMEIVEQAPLERVECAGVGDSNAFYEVEIQRITP